MTAKPICTGVTRISIVWNWMKTWFPTQAKSWSYPISKIIRKCPWFYKRNGHYYLAFASTCCPEGIGYAMSKNPLGPWEYKGHIMDHTPRTRGNHPGIIDYKGKSYCFGQNYDIFRLKQAATQNGARCRLLKWRVTLTAPSACCLIFTNVNWNRLRNSIPTVK